MLSICSLGEILTGIILGSMEQAFLFLPGLIILIPAMMQIRGIISGSFNARLSTALHIGTIKPSLRNNTSSFKKNIIVNIILIVIAPIWLSFFAWLICFLFHLPNIGFLGFLFVTLLSGVFSGIILTLLSVLMSIVTFRQGLDPDIIVNPLIAIIGDFFSILTFFLVSNLMIIILTAGGFLL